MGGVHDIRASYPLIVGEQGKRPADGHHLMRKAENLIKTKFINFSYGEFFWNNLFELRFIAA